MYIFEYILLSKKEGISKSVITKFQQIEEIISQLIYSEYLSIIS